MMSEVWRQIPSLLEYEASSLGRVRRVPYEAPLPHGGTRTYGGVPHYWQEAKGRRIFVFKGRSYKVHRVVCEAFHGPAPFEGAVVMHLDEDSNNNRPENLKWGTQKENLNAPGFLDYCRARTGENSPGRKGMARRVQINQPAKGGYPC